MTTTRIQVDKATAKRLNQLKDFGDSYDDVIKQLLDEHEEGGSG